MAAHQLAYREQQRTTQWMDLIALDKLVAVRLMCPTASALTRRTSAMLPTTPQAGVRMEVDRAITWPSWQKRRCPPTTVLPQEDSTTRYTLDKYPQ